ncbi:hypothetical protein F383_11347 [Gossypium arboreum]|uniref:Uncharacterized protein n=1 Tax=Gossypium arboreum TaxID=29729 RepID=A0A0B0N7B6_GOSAR|nr:hypothetical protein F383_11347 [Gossypium arboreum]
MYLLLNSGHP